MIFFSAALFCNSKLETLGEIKAEEFQLRYEEKQESLEQRREKKKQEQMLRAEIESLRVVDAQERKNRIERQEQYRREMVGKQIEEQELRVGNLTQLKEQLQDQRRARALRASVNQSKRNQLSLKGLTPGPAAYDPPTSCVVSDARGVAPISTVDGLAPPGSNGVI